MLLYFTANGKHSPTLIESSYLPMKATITSIELKGPLRFFALSKQAMHIIRQLKATKCREFKKKGIWTKHYTMTLWNNEDELKEFAKSGTHLKAMKNGHKIAKEI